LAVSCRPYALAYFVEPLLKRFGDAEIEIDFSRRMQISSIGDFDFATRLLKWSPRKMAG